MSLLLLDIEYDPRRKRILEIGMQRDGRSYKGLNRSEIHAFAEGTKWVCGHNVIHHDLPILRKWAPDLFPQGIVPIDTLMLSPLLRPDRAKHALDKDYHIHRDAPSNPLEDARCAGELLYELKANFNSQPRAERNWLRQVLGRTPEFKGFFEFLNQKQVEEGGRGPASVIDSSIQAESLLASRAAEPVSTFGGIPGLHGQYCIEADIPTLQVQHPIELACAVSLIRTGTPRIITPSWLLGHYPNLQIAMDKLRATHCGASDCAYCRTHLDPIAGLKAHFGYPGFRHFEGDGETPLQEQVVRSALSDESLLAVFPTGGGKSLTFQLPALMRGNATGALTVVISPLVSLMKDQVDVLKDRFDCVNAVTINGMLSPLERAEAIEQVEKGLASLIYISPESLRSATILRLFTKRIIDRFVIDEAHCFSAWGQDFRVDYGFIGTFLKLLAKKKMDQRQIPISCFTATARPEVVEDIKAYFKTELGLDLKPFITREQRKNLHYRVVPIKTKEEKFEKLIQILEEVNGPAIVYVARVKTTEELAERLSGGEVPAKAYNGRMHAREKRKVQDGFKDESIRVIVATSAFGMGVDKDNVELVVHYEISPSLENYAQEAGRAGRSKDLQAKCVVLYDETDLDQHFSILLGSKIRQKDIDQIWGGIKKFRDQRVVKSALELARKAGWNEDVQDLETKVRTAVNALEQVDYLKRELNSVRVFADSVQVENFEEGAKLLEAEKERFGPDFQSATRVLKSLVGMSRREKDTRVDYLGESLGLPKSTLVTILNKFKETGILGDFKDLTAEINLVNSKNGSKQVAQLYTRLERWLVQQVEVRENGEFKMRWSIRELNNRLVDEIEDSTTTGIRKILQVWEMQGFIRKTRENRVAMEYKISSRKPLKVLQKYVTEKLELSSEIVRELVRLQKGQEKVRRSEKQVTVEFSLVGIKKSIEQANFFGKKWNLKLFEQTLLYLNAIEAIDLKDGFLVFYNRLTLERLEKNNQKRYTREDFNSLRRHYEQKVEQIHIVGEYARKMQASVQAGQLFSADYFSMAYEDFLQKHFPQRKLRSQLKRAMTHSKFTRIFGELSKEQKAVVGDKQSQQILVAAGPGSGKTRVLVHKMASLLLLEDVDPGQFLMLAFSRPAAREFKERLYELIGKYARGVDIYTYHGFAFQLMGRVGDLKKSENIIEMAIEAIKNGEVPLEMVAAKSVIMLDEFQDVSSKENTFLQAIREVAGNPRVIAAGDDDQAIYGFRGASLQYMRALSQGVKSSTYFLTRNYRSRANLVDFSNQFLRFLPGDRIKSSRELIPHQGQNGTLKLVKYQGANLVEPLCKAIAEINLDGTIAVLTATNEQAFWITARLRDMGLPAIRLAAQDDFRLRNLLELQVFTHKVLRKVDKASGFIPPLIWKQNHEELMHDHGQSTDWPLVERVLDAFEGEFNRKFRSDWLAFVDQARLEDFFHPENGKITVSTMHKVKGKEFDKVLLLLDNYQMRSPEAARAVYVAITRAKSHLEIHTHLSIFDGFQAWNLERVQGKGEGTPLEVLSLSLSMKDVHLSSFKSKVFGKRVKALQAGDKLIFGHFEGGFHCLSSSHQLQVVRFSQKFKRELQGLMDQGFEVIGSSIEHIVIWWDKETEQGYRVVLPELELRRERG